MSVLIFTPPPTRHHRALDIPEIVRGIAEAIDYIVEEVIAGRSVSRFNKRAFLSFSLTCTMFCDPGLDQLWHTLADIRVLLNLFSSYQAENGHALRRAFLQGPIKTDEVERFEEYARRVRVYHHMPAITRRISPSVYIQVLRACGRFHMFPNLTSLHADVDVGDYHSFLGPTVRVFSITQNNAPLVARDNAWSMIENAQQTVKNLSAVRLQVLDNTMLTLPVGALIELASSPDLVDLHLEGNINLSSKNSPIPQVRMDSGLKKLQLMTNGHTLMPFIQFIESVALPRLEAICLAIASQPGDSEESQEHGGPLQWADTIHALKKATSKELKALMLKVVPTVPVNRPVNPVNSIRFQGFCFSEALSNEAPQLERFMAQNIMFDLPTYKDFGALKQSWSNLKHLTVFFKTPLPFASLAQLVLILPELKHLTTNVSSIGCETFVPMLIRKHQLKGLCMFMKELQEALPLAEGLWKLFPELEEMTVRPWKPIGVPQSWFDVGWKHLTRYLRVLRNTRGEPGTASSAKEPVYRLLPA